MLNRITSFFTEKMTPPQGDSSFRKNNALQIATCAILLEAANADNDLSEEEISHISKALRQFHKMDTAEINELIVITREESEKAIDLWQFTNLINQAYNTEEKIRLMEHIWMVILSDGTLDKFEEYIARKLQPLLRLNHKEWIEAKLNAKGILRDRA